MSLFKGEQPSLGTTVIQSTTGADNPLTIKNDAGTTIYTISNAGAVSPTGNVTIASGKTLAVTSADKLTVGGVIVPQKVVLTLPGFSASSVSQSVFIADAAYNVASIQEVHGTASSSGTLMLEKLTGTTAPGSGTASLTGTMSLSGTANTVVSGTLNADASIVLAAGDRLGLKFAGTMTSLANAVVTITLTRA